MIVPVYKKGDTDVPSNYRPITLLSTISKLFTGTRFRYINDLPGKLSRTKHMTNNPDNYRGITLLSCTCKLFTACINNSSRGVVASAPDLERAG